jgi:ATP-dependent protease ClpP protease subunit
MSWFKAQATGDRTANVIIDRAIGSDWAPDWIQDWTGEQPARDFIDAIEALGELDTINLELNSPGGDVASGIRIMNYLRNHKATVNITVTGMAASIATVIMMAGDTRTMGIGATLMVHNPAGWMAGFYTKAEMQEMAEAMGTVEAAIIEAYVVGTGKDADEIKQLLDRGDTYMTADDAIGWGMATDKHDSLRAVACADPKQFKQQLQLQGNIRAAEQMAEAAQAQANSYKAELDTLQASHEQVLSELDAFKNPVAATADDIIARCAEAGFEALAVPMAQAKLPMADVERRLKLAAEIKDVAKASGIDAGALMAHLDNPIQMLGVAVAEAKALVDQDLDNHTTPGTGTTAKQPDPKKAYAQLNNQRG